MARDLLIVGGSRGLGLAAAEHFVGKGDRVISVSRGPSPFGTWVEADVATDAGLDAVIAAVGDRPLDALLYLGGVWEQGAFTAAYDFFRSPRAETRHVLAVNLTAPILLAQGLAGALGRAANPRMVAIGALTAKDGGGGFEVANTASKFGLRGAAEALRAVLRPQGIGVTLIHPGNVATPEVEADIAEGRFGAQTPIPMADFLAALDFVLAVSWASVPVEIDLVQKVPGG